MHNSRFVVKGRVPNEAGGFRVFVLARNVAASQIPAVVERARLSVRGLEAWRVPERREPARESK